MLRSEACILLAAGLLAVGCGWLDDPELLAQRAAVDAWREAKVAFDRGETERAAALVDRARVAQPGEPLLALWEGRVREGIDPKRAIEAYSEAIRLQPDLGLAWLGRARLRAAAGDPSGASTDLERAIELGAIDGRGALEVAEFAPHLGNPFFSFLPASSLTVQLTGPTERQFWGSEVEIALLVEGAEDRTLSLSAAPAEGPLRLLRAVSDRVTTDGQEIRRLSWTFAVVGTGRVAIGPLQVDAEGRRGITDAVRFEAVVPPGRTAEATDPALWFDAFLLEEPEPGVTNDERGVRVVAAPGQRAELLPGVGFAIRYEWAKEGFTEQVGWWWPQVPAGTRLVIRQGAMELFNRPL